MVASDWDLSKMWISESGDGLPQSLSVVLKPGAEVRTVGWHCWHAYKSNPRRVSLWVAASEGNASVREPAEGQGRGGGERRAEGAGENGFSRATGKPKGEGWE